MCGINGFVLKDTEIGTAEEKLEIMNRCILHRGPDEDGFFVDKIHNQTVAFAMRRLSIIDLTSGKQPIYSADRSKVIVFNGEIYNFQILKQDLLNKGIKFNTASDTEVISKLYEEYGVAAFQLLDGMFAFSIFDRAINKVFIARDFFGEKPLYYTKGDKGLIWCSELKSLVALLPQRPKISDIGLNLYFQLTYIPAPFTIYEDVRKLEANHYIEYDILTDSLRIHEIHTEARILKQNIKFEEAKNEVRNKVRESVFSRSVSDVPIGTFLSGGVDSSIVSLCLAREMDQKINTFSIGVDKKSFDESEKAKEVARLIGSNHHEFIINEKDFADHIDKILLNFDEPFADSSALPSFLVANKTSAFVKVALTGDGGDEVFGGYNKYLMGSINQRYTSVIPEMLHKPFRKIANTVTKQKHDERGFKFQLKKAVDSIDYDGRFYYNIIRLGFKESELGKYLKTDHMVNDAMHYYKTKIPKPSGLSEFRKVDKLMSLEGDMIVKVDRTSMLTSLECRAPFLNKKLWDYSFSLPENYLLNGKNKKYILKKAFEADFPPNFLEKAKQGFGIPVGDWLKQGLKEELLFYCEPKNLEEQNIFQVEATKELVNRHLNSVEDNTFKVWTFFCFQKWYYQSYLVH